MSKKNPTHYVDKKAFCQALVEYRAACEGKTLAARPPVPEYIGECLLKIARGLASKHNYASYTYRQDMESAAVENCLRYLLNFDPSISKNPFGYFTQICAYSYWRFIKNEKEETYTKIKVAMHQIQQQQDYATHHDTTRVKIDPAWLGYENIQEFVRDFEEKLERAKSKVKDDTPKKRGVSLIPIQSYADDETDDEDETDVLSRVVSVFDDDEIEMTSDDPQELQVGF